MVGRRSRRNTHQKNCINSFIGASATNDLPNTMVASLGLTEIANHPEESIHHMGLFFMAARGVEIIGAVSIA
jgi:hypothetical protein